MCFPPLPDLTHPHRAISLHFKKFPEYPDFVWHNGQMRWYSCVDFNTTIAVYEDRVRGWFLERAQILQEDGSNGFVVLMVAISYLEGNQQYRDSKPSKNGVKKSVTKALVRIFPHLLNDQAAAFYEDARCGLFHDGMTRGRVFISNDCEEAVKPIIDGKLLVNPKLFLNAIINDFNKYVSDLRDETQNQLRENFVFHWNSAK